MSDLHIALADLKGLSRLFDNSSKLLLKPGEEYFSDIRQLIEKLESEVYSVIAPKSLRPEYRLQWQEYLQGKRTKIDQVAIRALCWASDIVHDPKFAEYLYRNIDVARARVIKGLVWSLHQKWSQKLPKKEITEYTALQLSSYLRSDRTLVKWKRDITTIVGENGPANFAKKNLLKELKSPKDASKEWALYEFSEYIYSAVTYAMDDCIEKISRSSDIIDYLFEALFIWIGWQYDRSVLDNTVRKLVFHPDVNKIRDLLQSSILKHPLLGDPRLPANKNKWFGVDKLALQHFIKWLSVADIHFFFDHVLKGQDRHGRRDFWLNYVDKLTLCRTLLNDIVASQFHGNNDISFGSLSKTQNKAAFILVFERIVAVEFSDAGHGSVYFFQREEFDKSIPDIWTRHHIPESLLKKKYIESIPHQRSWEFKVSNFLSTNGLRP